MGTEQKKGAEMGRNPQGVFKTMKKGSKRCTARTKGRRRMERLGEKQILWLGARVRENMRHHDMCGTTSPVEDFIEATWEKRTKEFLRWCRVVVQLQGKIDLEGKDF